MITKLKPFKPNTHSLEVLASATLEKNIILLNYQLKGNLDQVSLPPIYDHQRQIGLWEHTCFEFFLLDRETLSYYEFNFSPNGKWNCFYFNKSGDKLKEADCTLGKFETKSASESFHLTVEIDRSSLLSFPQPKNLYAMNLTVVLEVQKSLSYWAFEHGTERANFHDFNYYREIKKSGNKPKLVT